MSVIKDIHARQIFDSRGNPTIEVDVYTSTNTLGRSSVPSGASVGKYEAKYLLDGEKAYLGRGVTKAINSINKIIKKALVGKNIFDQHNIDQIMIRLDGTKDKLNLGANAILGVSLAVARAAAQAIDLPLYRYLHHQNTMYYTTPIPMLNIINGGVHADNNIDFQEFLILPIKAKNFAHALKMGAEVFWTLKMLFKKKKYATNVGDEGGFAPNLTSFHIALDYILQAIEKAGYVPGKDIFLGIDAAASELYDVKKKRYILQSTSDKQYSSEEMIVFWNDIIQKYPIISLEDPLAEEDWEGWKKITKNLGHKIQLVGDDLFVTKEERLQEGISNQVANAILIKPNQVGTLSETKDTIDLAKKANYHYIFSHRSGETEDTTIADLAIAYQATQIKAGALTRSERLAKYNQILRIEEALGKKAVYYGEKIFS